MQVTNPAYGCLTCESVCINCWPTYEYTYEVKNKININFMSFLWLG